MPAVSDKQRKFMNVVAAAQKGDKKVTGAAKKAAKSMSKKSVEDYAHTKGKLPKQAVKESITMQQPVEEARPGQYEPELMNNVNFHVVMKPTTPGDDYMDLTFPTTPILFANLIMSGKVDVNNIAGFYMTDEEAQGVAQGLTESMYQSAKELEEKKMMVTEKIAKAINKLQKHLNNELRAADENPANADQHQMKAEAIMMQIKKLRENNKMVESSKKELPSKDEE